MTASIFLHIKCTRTFNMQNTRKRLVESQDEVLLFLQKMYDTLLSENQALV